MANIQLIVRELRNQMNAFELEKSINSSENETQTRMYLVEPFFKWLGYARDFGDMNLTPEYDAYFANQKGKKVDYAIQFKKKPEIIIEVKKASIKLNINHLQQLNEYFIYTNESKIGVLTNGIEYQFYCRKTNGGKGLHPTPFLCINLEKIEGNSLEKLAKFHVSAIEIKSILEDAQNLFFIEDFEKALFKELSDPSKDFIKAIFSRMDGSRISSNIENEIKSLINSVSLKSALEKLIVQESAKVNSGIFTTDEELKIFHVIKTLLAQHKKIQSDSIGYRDQKGKFSILLDGNLQKKICDLYLSPSSKKVEIAGEKFDIPDDESILKLKKALVNRALSLI